MAESQAKGTFIVIDGSDGTGKKTQYQLFLQRLQVENIAHQVFDFPRYGQPSAFFVEKYLAGEYGTLDEVSAQQASLFYAMDRYDAAGRIRATLQAGKIVLANRFTISNMGHQGAKLDDIIGRTELYKWIDSIEHETLKIPRPDLNIILSIPSELAQANIDRRSVEDNRHKDIHESDPHFMQRSINVYNELCDLFPERCVRIDCAQNDTEMKPALDIHEIIWKKARLSS